MSAYSVAVIGTGPDPENPGRDGYAMGYQHADAYETIDECELVACADIVPENARAFADRFGLAEEGIFEDFTVMLEEARPDVVSVCVPPAIHADICIDCARAESVRAIHCEKPMDLTWGGARLMTQEADRHDVNLTFNHQRRFGEPFRKAKKLLDDGAIGDLERVEFSAGNLYDYGSHSIDLCNYFNDEHPADWVIGQIDYRRENVFFGARSDLQGLALWEYENGVHGLASTGEKGADAVACHNRLVGADGVIELGPEGGPTLRVRSAGSAEWEELDCGGETMHGPGYIERALEDVVRALETGEESELCARNALNAMEIIFATWESSRRRGRVDLPLEIEDNPLDSMVESGQLAPEPAGEDA